MVLGRRMGSEDVQVQVRLAPRYIPPQYRLSQPLADLLGIPQESRQGVLQALWVYMTTSDLLVSRLACIRPAVKSAGLR